MPLSLPPWTDEQVAALNAWQANPMAHPYTCGSDRCDAQHKDGASVLVAARDGWVCLFCDYRQFWAADWMAFGWQPKVGQ